ncbi:MAG TPA: hypothetical protein VKD72_07130, partial [Gemmataceae bacterium]|nr:hypothetical protein [Gemmataceae bacterium]
MAATDKPYRNQPTLNVVFAVSCVVMLLTVLWMLVDDYNREFKGIQRLFRDVEAKHSLVLMLKNMPNPKQVRTDSERLADARTERQQKQTELQSKPLVDGKTYRDLIADRDRAYARYQGLKADFDAMMSYVDIAVEQVGAAPSESRRTAAEARVADRKKQLQELKTALDASQKDLEDKYNLIKFNYSNELEPLERKVAQREDQLKVLTGPFDRYAKLAAEKRWKPGDTFRNLPIIDAFASPTRIHQIVLNDLPIEYGSFKEVTRYDRCATCHLGIERANYDRESLADLNNQAQISRLNDKLPEARDLLEQRAAAGEKLGFDPDDLPGKPVAGLAPAGVNGFVGFLYLLLALVNAVAAGALLSQSPGQRGGIVWAVVAVLFLVLSLAHLGAAGWLPSGLGDALGGFAGLPLVLRPWVLLLPLAGLGAVIALSPRLGQPNVGLAVAALLLLCFGWMLSRPTNEPELSPVELTDAQITQFKAHPRLDLFIDSNSPHPMEKFGCTVCHNGQGSATSFVLASHTPTDAAQKERWEGNGEDGHGWSAIHDWDFPMHPKRFVESGCVKCHHQMTDLIRYGSKEEAPKLLVGYRLVRENGCFGCHEIAGLKSGRAVGPDLRLEPTPPIEWLPPKEQRTARSDPLNPPGTQRKVGPSLRRLDEKVDPKWLLSWIKGPRNFRADTKMPHFYGLSTNNAEHLKNSGTGQEAYPDAE